MRTLLVLAAVVAAAAPGSARADAIAFTCRAAPNVKPVATTGQCTGFVAHDAGGRVVQHVDKGFEVSGMILATPDGSTVAVVHSYPLTPDKGFDKLDALIFYRGGKVVARYSMADLIERMNLVTESVSHTRWIGSTSSTQDLALGKTLDLTTTSLRTYSFDVATGKKLTADDTSDWKACDLLVYLGETPPAPRGDVYTIAKPYFAKGKAAAPLTVRAAPGARVESGNTLCVTSTKAGNTATKNIDVMLNALTR